MLVCIHFLCNQVAFSFVMIQTDAHIQAVQECCCATTTGSHLVCWFRAGLEDCLAVMWLILDDKTKKAQLTLSLGVWRMESPPSNPPTYPNEMQLVFYQMLLSLRIKGRQRRYTASQMGGYVWYWRTSSTSKLRHEPKEETNVINAKLWIKLFFCKNDYAACFWFHNSRGIISLSALLCAAFI